MNDNNYLQQTTTDRLGIAVKYLKSQKLIMNQKDLAAKMGITPVTISRYMRGVFSAERFLPELNAKFQFIFSTEWMMYGNGPMLTKDCQQHSDVHTSIIRTASTTAAAPPSWASSLIDLVAQNTQSIENLLRDNLSLRSQLTQLTEEVRRLRTAISALQYEPTVPRAMMAAENHEL